MIKAIIFDFGNVIYSFDNFKFLRSIASFSKHTVAQLDEILYRRSDLPDRFEHGKIGADAFFREVCELADVRMPQADFNKAFTDIFTPIPSTLGLIKRLHGRYRLALLSNTNELDFQAGIKPCEVFPLFESVTLSFEVGAMKPDRRIFEDALRKLGLRAQECVYVDDVDIYCAAARDLGFHVIHFNKELDLELEFNRIGINVS